MTSVFYWFEELGCQQSRSIDLYVHHNIKEVHILFSPFSLYTANANLSKLMRSGIFTCTRAILSRCQSLILPQRRLLMVPTQDAFYLEKSCERSRLPAK